MKYVSDGNAWDRKEMVKNQKSFQIVLSKHIYTCTRFPDNIIRDGTELNLTFWDSCFEQQSARFHIMKTKMIVLYADRIGNDTVVATQAMPFNTMIIFNSNRFRAQSFVGSKS